MLALAGLVFGTIGGWFGRGALGAQPSTSFAPRDLHADAPSTDATNATTSTDLLPPAANTGTRTPATTVEEEPTTAPSDDDGDPRFSRALMEHAAVYIDRGWRSERTDTPREDEVAEGLDTFRAETLELPARIGRDLAVRRSNLELAQEDARTGGVLSTLKRLQDGGPGPLTDLVADRATFDRFFVTETTGSAIDGPSALSSQALSSRKPVPDGTTLSFPAGVHMLQDFGTYWREHFPRDLTLRGAGMNATLLVLNSDLSAYDTVRNLTIEHVTLHANDNYMFDVRDPAMSVTLRNARFTGWDMGAGASCLFGTEGLALRATDCEFLGGYGRSPQHGQLFDVRHNGLLARFERCLVARTEAFGSITSGATVVFSACRLEDLLDRQPAGGGEAPANVLLDGTSLTRWSKDHSAPLARDLNDLFPGWREALRR
jgi:hypothetical protein